MSPKTEHETPIEPEKPETIESLREERDILANALAVKNLENQNLAARNANLAAETAHWQTQAQLLSSQLQNLTQKKG